MADAATFEASSSEHEALHKVYRDDAQLKSDNSHLRILADGRRHVQPCVPLQPTDDER